MLALGRVLYAFAYLEWLVICVLHDRGIPVQEVAHQTAGAIAQRLTKASCGDIQKELARRFAREIVKRRDDLSHARPATLKEGQRLYRWKKDQKTGAVRHCELDLAWLSKFATEIDALTIEIDSVFRGGSECHEVTP